MNAVFVYTREAHPGEVVPAHETMDAKLAMARRMVQRWSIERPMLVDDLDGSLHRAWGLLPNMAWIVNRRGRIVYKASWTDATNLDVVVSQLIREAELKADGARQVPFTVEWAPQRAQDSDAFLSGLLEAGPQAVEEYISAIENVRGKATARRLRAWWEERRAEE